MESLIDVWCTIHHQMALLATNAAMFVGRLFVQLQAVQWVGVVGVAPLVGRAGATHSYIPNKCSRWVGSYSSFYSQDQCNGPLIGLRLARFVRGSINWGPTKQILPKLLGFGWVAFI